MCLDTAIKLDPVQEGIGFKCFREHNGELATAGNYYPVKRGEWITNEQPNKQIGDHPFREYRSGFHILERADEALLYLGYEYSMHSCPWWLSRYAWKIYPVRYKNAHTRGTQYGCFQVIVADDIYVMTDKDIEVHESEKAPYIHSRSYLELLRPCSLKY